MSMTAKDVRRRRLELHVSLFELAAEVRTSAREVRDIEQGTLPMTNPEAFDRALTRLHGESRDDDRRVLRPEAR